MSSTSDSIPTPTASVTSSDDGTSCDGSPDNSQSFLHLRILSIFIILITSTIGALFPVLARRSRLNNVIPKSVFDFAKYFGSGVIIATAFIHLLDPATDELSNPCLTGAWQVYPWALALCMFSIFALFFAELVAFRWGTAKLKKLGITYDPHGHNAGGNHAAHGPEAGIRDGTRGMDSRIMTNAVSDSSNLSNKEMRAVEQDVELGREPDSLGDNAVGKPLTDSAMAQIIGVFILEFGVILHSVLIGLTLAVDESFKILFVVLVFHQMFEGLGLGSRLAFLALPKRYNYVAYAAAGLYGLTTPIGIAAGLGVRTTYNPNSAKASAVSGIMDSLSAGVLIYTGLVELLAHEFLFNPGMRDASNRKLAYACCCMLAGAGLMALLGRWA